MLGFACFPTISSALSVRLMEFRSETQQLTTLNPTYITPAPKSVITRVFSIGSAIFQGGARVDQPQSRKVPRRRGRRRYRTRPGRYSKHNSVEITRSEYCLSYHPMITPHDKGLLFKSDFSGSVLQLFKILKKHSRPKALSAVFGSLSVFVGRLNVRGLN